jgi:ribosomal subunit interface protein
MINLLQISGVHTEHTEAIDAYVRKKIGGCDRYIPKKARQSSKADVKLKEGKSKDQAKFTCEVIVHLPHGSITVHEKATTMFAAIDVAEDKLKVQLRKYKEKHAGPRIHRKVIARFIRNKKR